MKKPRICFLALNAYPTIAGTPEARVGGAEVQQLILARYLVKQGHEVFFVTRDHGQPEAVVIDGITVLRSFRSHAGLPYVRFFHPRWTAIWKALLRADADVFYQRCAGMETGLLAMFCSRYRKKFVFASASDADFDIRHPMIPTWRDRLLFGYGLRRAAAIIAQTETQRALLRNNYALDAQVIPNCWEERPSTIPRGTRQGYVLWVSTLRTWKRPELFVELARSLPEVRFVMAGGPALGKEDLYEEIANASRSLKNLSFEGFVPFGKIDSLYENAALLVNTSLPIEGFPNTFLQAWSHGIPVVSFFDPDGVIKRRQLGIAADTFVSMRDSVISLTHDSGLYEKCQKNVLEYFAGHHHVSIIGPRYENVFSDLWTG